MLIHAKAKMHNSVQALGFLTDFEREPYDHLADLAWARVLRVAQGRIPLVEAPRRVLEIAGA